MCKANRSKIAKVCLAHVFSVAISFVFDLDMMFAGLLWAPEDGRLIEDQSQKRDVQQERRMLSGGVELQKEM